MFVGEIHKCTSCEPTAITAEMCWSSMRKAGCKAASRTGDVWALEARNTQRINNQANNKPLLRFLLLLLLALKDEPPTSASLSRTEDHTVPKPFVMMFPH